MVLWRKGSWGLASSSWGCMTQSIGNQALQGLLLTGYFTACGYPEDADPLLIFFFPKIRNLGIQICPLRQVLIWCGSGECRVRALIPVSPIALVRITKITFAFSFSKSLILEEAFKLISLFHMCSISPVWLPEVPTMSIRMFNLSCSKVNREICFKAIKKIQFYFTSSCCSQ